MPHVRVNPASGLGERFLTVDLRAVCIGLWGGGGDDSTCGVGERDGGRVAFLAGAALVMPVGLAALGLGLGPGFARGFGGAAGASGTWLVVTVVTVVVVVVVPGAGFLGGIVCNGGERKGVAMDAVFVRGLRTGIKAVCGLERVRSGDADSGPQAQAGCT